MLTTTDILLGMLLPLAIAAAGVVIALVPPVRGRERAGRATITLAAGIGWLTAYASLPGQAQWTQFPPHDSLHWLFWAGIVITALALADVLVARGRWWARAPVVLVAAAVVVWLLLRPIIIYEWTTATAAAWVGGLAVASLGAWLCADRPATAGPRPAAPVALALVAAGTAVVLTMSGSVKLGQIALALAWALTPVAAASVFLPRVPIPRSIALLATLPLVGLVVYGHFFAEVTPIDAALLLSAALLLWVGTLIPVRRQWQRATLAIVLAAIPMTVAVGRSVAGFLEDQRNPDPYEMYY